MKITMLVGSILLFIMEAGFCQKPAPPLPPPPPNPGAYDTIEVKRYYDEIVALKAQENKIISDLIREINSTKHLVLKEKLILLLGEFDNEEAIRFLINNLTYQSRYREEGGADSYYESFPCKKALSEKKSLYALPFIEIYLQECRTDLEIRLLKMVLSSYILSNKIDSKWILGKVACTPKSTCFEKNVAEIIKLMKSDRTIR